MTKHLSVYRLWLCLSLIKALIFEKRCAFKKTSHRFYFPVFLCLHLLHTQLVPRLPLRPQSSFLYISRDSRWPTSPATLPPPYPLPWCQLQQDAFKNTLNTTGSRILPTTWIHQQRGAGGRRQRLSQRKGQRRSLITHRRWIRVL